MFEKLKLNKEFRRVYGRGKSIVSPFFVSYVLRQKGEKIRIGITVSKKIGCAVMRNRAKRLITAAFYECAPDIKHGCDIVFVLRHRILSKKSYEVAEIMKAHLKQSGIFEEK